MLNYILPRIPANHKLYVEPFFGSGAVFFNKPPAEQSVVNDINPDLIALYRELRDNLDGIARYLSATPYSRVKHAVEAKAKIKDPNATQFDRGAALFILIGQGFAGGPTAWGYGIKNENSRACTVFQRKKKRQNLEYYSARLQNAIILNQDAVNVIQEYDRKDAFFFLDPPYAGCDQHHYVSQYNESDLKRLLDLMANMQGRFMFTHYINPIIKQYIEEYNWHVCLVRQRITVKVLRDEQAGDDSIRDHAIITNYLV